MASSRKYFKASSLLESIIALVIISACLYIAMAVYANVFSAKRAPETHRMRHKMAEQFYLHQLDRASDGFQIDETWLHSRLKETHVSQKDKDGRQTELVFYSNPENGW